jgi:hypothetical protein
VKYGQYHPFFREAAIFGSGMRSGVVCNLRGIKDGY